MNDKIFCERLCPHDCSQSIEYQAASATCHQVVGVVRGKESTSEVSYLLEQLHLAVVSVVILVLEGEGLENATEVYASKCYLGRITSGIVRSHSL